ncbi:MAG: DUF3052 domain-containing protein [Actinomycetota bacterium]|nr:DUF3052 domain-containing protein [Actinomycetota bacterium]
MPAYSSTPLARKLGVKAQARVALLQAPEDFTAKLGELPAGVTLRRRVAGVRCDVIVAFNTRAAQLERRLPGLKARLTDAGGLWLAWPKRTSGVVTDLTEGTVRTMGLQVGLVDNKICAIDDTWSGLRFVYRTADRPRAKV